MFSELPNANYVFYVPLFNPPSPLPDSCPAEIFLIQTASTEMSAGVIPLMREA
jgi:hypothetical protein